MPASSKREARSNKRRQKQKQTGERTRAAKGAKDDMNIDNVVPIKFQEQRDVAPLQAKTERQKEYLESLKKNTITIATGHAGSGKTYCASYYAAQLFNWGIIDQIVITRPYAHLGKDAGSVPGTDFEKLEAFVRPMLDVIKQVLGHGNYQYCINHGKIEVAPLEKIQGRSFDSRVAIIADEIQNASRPQAVSLSTRLGEEVEFLAICGDPRQAITRGYNTLDWLSDFFERNTIRSSQVVHFTEDDCVRSGIVKDILIALEKEGGYYNDL